MRLMPGRAEEIERRSRAWLIASPNCAFERTSWDVGGVRHGARSRGKRIGLRCPSCAKHAMHLVEHRPSDHSQQAEEG
jgi:hypothetical protein